MKTNYFFIAALLIFYTNIAYAQYGRRLVMPSQNSTSLIKAVNTPVNLYTGTVNVKVPFYTLEGRKTNVPVSINYLTKGIKVDEGAGLVGLGWRLSAGGMITRIVRGLPDEQGYCGINYEDGRRAISGEESRMHQKIIGGGFDGEPDLFYFEFPGRIGKFVLDENGDAFTIPYESMIIKPAIGLKGEGEWTITDENGIRYIFGSSSSNSYHEVTHSVKYERHGGSGEEFTKSTYPFGSRLLDMEYISTWYLRKIEMPNGNIEFTFDYMSGEAVVDYNFSYFAVDKIENGCDGLVSDYKAIKIENTIEEPKYLQRINGPVGFIEFKYSEERLDRENGVKLMNIIVKNMSNELIEKYRLNYRYFNSNRTALINQSCLHGICYRSENLYRLCLQSIYKIGNDQSQILFREFKYDETQSYLLHPRYSMHQDHWGYGNSPDNQTSYYMDIPQVLFDDGTFLDGDEKDKDLASLSLLLKEMKIPTKGSIKYDYKTNLTGGALIEKITITDNENIENDIIKTYTYENPAVANTPVYHYRYNQYYLDEVYVFSIFGFPLVIKDDCYLDLVLRTSKSMKALYDIDGVSVGYGLVTETLQDGSYTEYTFTTYNDHPNDLPEIYTAVAMIKRDEIRHKAIRSDYDSPPFFPHTYLGWERGLLKTKRVFDANSHIKSEITNDYYFDLDNKKVINGYSMKSYATDEEGNFIVHVGNYKIISRPIRLKQTNEKIYSKSISTTSPSLDIVTSVMSTRNCRI